MVNLELMFKDDKDFAEQCMRDTGQLLPMFAVHYRKNGKLNMIAIAADFSSLEAKKKSVDFIRLIGIAIDAYAISMLSEAWVATVTPNMDNAVQALMPSERMDRKEVVMVTMSARGETRFSVREILRNGDGSFSGLGPDTAADGESFSGRMTGLVMPRRPSKEEQGYAYTALEMLGFDLKGA